MARSRPGTAQQYENVERIDLDENEELEHLGSGSFGRVYKTRCRGRTVALKFVNTEESFDKELSELSKAQHENIVKLYGYSITNKSKLSNSCEKCLVLEYADRGSLDQALHGNSSIEYTAAHAINWGLQCARGVAYLHSTSTVHRDLKPANLLLFGDGNTLKICDLGIACPQRNEMTNSRGSMMWMAPEVIRTTKYNEKVDVYSWGLILWEMLTRHKPYENSDIALLFHVCNGQRPPPIKDVPLPIKQLYERCWEDSPDKRPSMETIVKKMEMLFPFFCTSGKLPPVFVSNDTSEDSMNEADEEESSESDVVIPDEYINSLRNSVTEMRLNPEPRYFAPLAVDVSNGFESKEESTTYSDAPEASQEGCSYPTLSKASSSTQRPPLQETRREHPSRVDIELNGGSCFISREFGTLYDNLDPNLHPIEPDRNCPQSVQIFKEHIERAEELVRCANEAAILDGEIVKLNGEVLIKETEYESEIRKLKAEKHSLLLLKSELEEQLRTLVPSG